MGGTNFLFASTSSSSAASLCILNWIPSYEQKFSDELRSFEREIDEAKFKYNDVTPPKIYQQPSSVWGQHTGSYISH